MIYRLGERQVQLQGGGHFIAPNATVIGSVILIDTVRAEGAPGQIRRYGREDLLRHAPAQRLSPHDPGVKETLASLEFSGNGPGDVFAVGWNGTILHYDGTSWSGMASATSASIEGVWGSSPSDIFAVGKKISGNAQYATSGRMFSHGTLLFDSDLDQVTEALLRRRRRRPRPAARRSPGSLPEAAR